jgi:hypothetical protein
MILASPKRLIRWSAPFAGCLLANGLAQTSPPVRDAREIVRISVSKDFANNELARNYTMVQRTVNRVLDGGGNVKSTESQTRESLFVGGEPYHRLIARNDAPLSPAEAAKEAERLRKISEKRQQETPGEKARRLADREKRRAKRRAGFKEIPDAFDFKLLPDEKLDGREVWVMEAWPHPGYKPQSAEAGILGKFHGKLWIDKAEYQWVKMDCETLDTVSFGLFLARLNKGSRVQFEQTRVNGELWMMRRVTARYDARLVLVKHFIGETEVTNSDFRKFQAESKITGVSEK